MNRERSPRETLHLALLLLALPASAALARWAAAHRSPAMLLVASVSALLPAYLYAWSRSGPG